MSFSLFYTNILWPAWIATVLTMAVSGLFMSLRDLIRNKKRSTMNQFLIRTKSLSHDSNTYISDFFVITWIYLKLKWGENGRR